MDLDFIQNKAFDDIDGVRVRFTKAEYEDCSVVGCDLSNADISGAVFQDCWFKDCNISLAKLKNTAFRDVEFIGCKMLGIQWGDCNQFSFSASFENCIMDNSSFYKVKLKNGRFRNTRLNEVDFTETDLSGTVFNDCDLSGATFENTILEGADLRTAIGYTMDPEMNKLKKAKFSLEGLPGLLLKYGIEVEK